MSSAADASGQTMAKLYEKSKSTATRAARPPLDWSIMSLNRRSLVGSARVDPYHTSTTYIEWSFISNKASQANVYY